MSLDASLNKLQHLMAAYSRPWWVCGGWAVDLAVGHLTREHHDLEICIPRRELPHLRHFVGKADWETVVKNESGSYSLRPLAHDESIGPDEHELYVAIPGFGMLEVLLDEFEGGLWQFRRNSAITLSREAFGHLSSEGIPYCTLEVVLLYKGKKTQPKDELDFEALLPVLDAAQRQWLRDALSLMHPGHGWVERLK